MKKIKLVFILILLMIGWIGLVHSKQVETVTKTENTTLEPQTKMVLYFPNCNTGEFVKEYRYVSLNEVKDNVAETILKELLKGPNDQGLRQAIPQGTKLNHVTIEGSKAVVDFSKQFIEKEETEITRLPKIYSVVNSLTELKEIQEVEITIEGTPYATKQRI